MCHVPAAQQSELIRSGPRASHAYLHTAGTGLEAAAAVVPVLVVEAHLGAPTRRSARHISKSRHKHKGHQCHATTDRWQP
jgi:hypothetical protein